MATIKDIAREAGVAQGTVSNVLNNRGNVSSEKIRRVLEACQSLGYVPNERAKQLRSNQTRLLGVLLPDLSDKRHIDFYLSFQAYAESHGYVVRQYLAAGPDNASSEASIQQEVIKDGFSGMAVFAGSAYMMHTPLSEEIKVVYAEHRPAFSAPYIGFDYEQAGRDIAESIKKEGLLHVVLLTGGLWSSNDADFCRGFRSVAKKTSMHVAYLQTDKQSEHLNILQCPDIAKADAIVCSRLELAQTVRHLLGAFTTGALPALYTLSPLFTLPEGDFKKYELNYRLLGHAAAQNLIRQLEGGPAPSKQLLSNTGFRSWKPPMISIPAAHPINVVTLDSPSAYNMRDIAKLYTKQTGIPVQITIYSYDETYEIFNSMRENAVFDVIRLDVAWLSFFAQKILRPLEEIDPHIAKELGAFLAGTAGPYGYVGDTLYAFPSSPSTQLLFYRSDLFSNAMYRRMFQEQYGCELTVPKTFEAYNRIAAFFTRSINPDSPVEFGSTLTLGSTAVACSEYLARLFALQENLYNENNQVVLSDPPYVRALELLLEIRACSDPNYCSWWRNTASAFAGGNTAMAIMYNNYASPLVAYTSKVRSCIGYAMMPGGRPLLGGGCMGVSRFTDQPEQALNFIRWYCSEPVASANTFLGSVSPCEASYDNYEIVNMYPWLKRVRSSFTAARGRRTPPASQVPFDERRFMSIIGMAVKNAYSGALPPQQAMNYAQKLFDEQFGHIYAPHP
ncbi:MAG: extracellular solute-binding protein [Clostridia bacterium]|nr:extracellular solute-binding protein [Clostridia bacterium]